MKGKRILPLLLAGCLLMPGLPGANANAMTVKERQTDSRAEMPAKTTAPNTAAPITAASEKDTLTLVTKRVKEKLEIPSRLSEFSYQLFTPDLPMTKEKFSLNWESKDTKESIFIDADFEGRISRYQYRNEQDSLRKPLFKKDSLRPHADAFLKKALPDICNRLSYVSSAFQGAYSGTYLFQYQRIENAIPVPDNSVMLGVDYENGEVTFLDSSNWDYDLSFPSAETAVTKAEAIDQISRNVAMKLTYQSLYAPDSAKSLPSKAYLVYAPDKFYLSVDAKTGTVYESKQGGLLNGPGAESPSGAASAEYDKEDGGLTQKEIQKIDEIADILSKNEAIKTIQDNTDLLLNDKFTQVTARLFQQPDSRGRASYVWSLFFEAPAVPEAETGKYFGGYGSSARAIVDAKTGQLLSYNTWMDTYADPDDLSWKKKLKFSQEECHKAFDAFAEKNIPAFFKETAFTDASSGYIIGYEKDNSSVYGGYTFLNERLYKSVPYPDNNISGSVDAVTGKIYSFQYNWNETAAFEKSDNILSPSQAFDQYIQKDGFQLIYEIVWDYGAGFPDSLPVQKVRLVYNTAIAPSRISPFTGKQLNYDGSVYSPKGNYAYIDIASSDARKSIEILADMGCGFPGGSFLPDKAITKAELLGFLDIIPYRYNSAVSEYRNNASTLRRLDAAKLSVSLLGLDHAAKLTDIYSVSFEDAEEIPKSDTGYLALAKGFRLLVPDTDNRFRPNDQLTRAEAADMIISLFYAQ